MEIINKRFSTNKTLRNFYNPLHEIFNLSPGYYFLCKYGNYKQINSKTNIKPKTDLVSRKSRNR